MSDKLLYNETKAEKQFLIMMTATISHELRNPLSSLMSQIQELEQLTEELSDIKDELPSKAKNKIELVVK